ncbi:alpha/beta fold hydrolase [Ornithinicoccus halotolerans]|uniref:alpha/beta fold hydrolase n=1 Tax=Ornithinicoccus halotolerans TaxID=1748220 RepID=UPI0012950A08|nr:alpha/beta fold hydrolase [Ornithinicoccus halotolerans]
MSETTDQLNVIQVGQDGPTVVFLHGLFGQGRNFNQIAKGLTPDYRSLLVDLPNHGRSPWTVTFDYNEHADLVAARLRADGAGEDPVHLVGHSMGGKVAMLLALRHPELVRRLVVVDIGPVHSGEMSEFEHLLDSLAGLDLERVESRTHADELLSEPITTPTVRGFLLQNLRRDGDGWRWQANLELLRRELPAIGGFPEHEGSYDGPVLWVAGEKSPYIEPEDGPAMRRLFPRTRLVTVKDSGHWVHSEQPEHFVATLRVFLGAQTG